MENLNGLVVVVIKRELCKEIDNDFVLKCSLGMYASCL